MFARIVFPICALFLFDVVSGCDQEVKPDQVPAAARRAAVNYDGDGDYSADRTGPSDADKARGYTMDGELLKPIETPCVQHARAVFEKEGACSRELFVDICGERDAEGKPTGLYEKGACPACDALHDLRNAKPAGC